MSKSRKKPDKHGFVYSTNPDFEFEKTSMEQVTLPPAEQRLRIVIDRQQRRGKEVTLVTGFVGATDDLKELGKLLKSRCGVGGSVKNGEILLQGNQRDKVIEYLKSLGYLNVKKSGG